MAAPQSPYYDKSTSDSNASRSITASEERLAVAMVRGTWASPKSPPGSREATGRRVIQLDPDPKATTPLPFSLRE